MHTMTEKKVKSGTIDVKALLAGDEEFLRALVRTALQEVLETEMTEALGAEKGERTTGREGYRSGYYGRTLITRIGKLELRVPQDRAGRFSTELFERYQRSERALAEGVRHGSLSTRTGFRVSALSGLSKTFPANHHVDNGGDVRSGRTGLRALFARR
jgi:transposase-like protein